MADDDFRGHGDLTPPHHAISASMTMDAGLLEVPATTVYIAASGLHFSEFAQSKDQPVRRAERLCRFSRFDRPSPLYLPQTVSIASVLAPCPLLSCLAAPCPSSNCAAQARATAGQDRPRGHVLKGCDCLIAGPSSATRAGQGELSAAGQGNRARKRGARQGGKGCPLPCP